jgi:hypothetical protein
MRVPARRPSEIAHCRMSPQLIRQFEGFGVDGIAANTVTQSVQEVNKFGKLTFR